MSLPQPQPCQPLRPRKTSWQPRYTVRKEKYLRTISARIRACHPHFLPARNKTATALRTAIFRSSSKRSEERRVGKECALLCRSRWSPDHLKKKRIIGILVGQLCFDQAYTASRS